MSKLTIGMAVYDDPGAWFTLQALRMYHPEVMDQAEIIVVDNKPDSVGGDTLRNMFGNWLTDETKFRYIEMPEPVGTAAPRNRIFEEARGEIVVVMDPHVFLSLGSLDSLLGWFNSNPESLDLLTGPMVYDDLKTVETEMNPEWRGDMWGIWGRRDIDPFDDTAFEIWGHGLGLFSCRKEAWLGFSPHFRGFGGEEGYIHEKFRQAGRTCWCLPFLRWTHKFNFLKSGQQVPVKYPLEIEDRIRNYIIGHLELGLSLAPVANHFVMRKRITANRWNLLVAQSHRLLGNNVPDPEPTLEPEAIIDVGLVEIGYGPGTELALITKALGIPSCQRCKELSIKMDHWGVDGSRERFEEIVAQLRDRSSRFGWAIYLKAGARAVKAGIIVNPLDPIPGLVSAAIARGAAEKQGLTVLI